MRIAVEHRTRYRFTEPQARVIQLLRLTPADTQEQTVVAWGIDVDVDARLRTAHDGFGNTITMLYADGPVDALDVTVTGEVLTLDGTGLVHGAPEPLPPELFLRWTPRTKPHAQIADFVAGVARATPLATLHGLNEALYRRYEVAPVGRDEGWSAAAAFPLERLSPRDMAQIFLVAARAIGIPARYVSGYRSTDHQPSCTAHAWAEAHVEGIGWIGFDPSAGISPDQHYVRVAVGLDASGAAPIVGHRIGTGEEELAVDLHVDRLGEE